MLCIVTLWIAGCVPGFLGDDGAGTGGEADTSGPLHVFAGSAIRPPLEELASLYESKFGTRVVLHLGGSGQMLAQLRLSERGDVFLPGSSDYMELAKARGDVLAETETRIAYLVPAIIVPRSNPARIERLEDLARDGVRVAIARPDAVCVGLYAVEVLEKTGLAEQVRRNIVVQAESCEKVAQIVSLGLVDAAIGWRVFEHWKPDALRAIPIDPRRVPRIGYIAGAVAARSKLRAKAGHFLEFLTSDEAKAVLSRWGYIGTEVEARRWAGPSTPVGGRWQLPPSWP